MNENLMMEIVEGLVESADELAAKDERDLFEAGQLLGYIEALAIIRDAHAGYDLAKIGLDFDIDAKYLAKLK